MNLDPETKTFLDAMASAGSPPIYALTPDAARRTLSAVQARPFDAPAADIAERTIPVGPRGMTRLAVVRPRGATERLPAVLYFHGVGWVLGGLDTHRRLVQSIAHGAHAAVVLVDYGRAPEHRHPVAIEEGYAALAWLAAHGRDLGIDGARLAIAGDDVGGHMVAAVSLLAKERGGPAIRFQLLLTPVTDAGCATASYETFADGPWLTRDAMKWFWNAYLPVRVRREDPHVSPLRASLEQLAGQAPALIVTAENDVLRDEGEAYAHRLARAGVRVTAVRYLGTIHDFVLLDALSGTPAARSAVALAAGMLAQALAPQDGATR